MVAQTRNSESFCHYQWLGLIRNGIIVFNWLSSEQGYQGVIRLKLACKILYICLSRRKLNDELI